MGDEHEAADWLEILQAIAKRELAAEEKRRLEEAGEEVPPEIFEDIENGAEAWAVFYEYWWPWTVLTANQYTRDRNLAEDAAQCGLLKFHRDVAAMVRLLENMRRRRRQQGREFTEADQEHLIKFFLRQRIRRCLRILAPPKPGQLGVGLAATVAISKTIAMIKFNLVREILTENSMLGTEPDPTLTELEREAARLTYLEGLTAAETAERLAPQLLPTDEHSEPLTQEQRVNQVYQANARARKKLRENLDRVGMHGLEVIEEVLTGRWKPADEVLTVRELAALKCYYVDSLSHSEATDAMQISQAEFTTLLQSGRKKLAVLLNL